MCLPYNCVCNNTWERKTGEKQGRPGSIYHLHTVWGWSSFKFVHLVGWHSSVNYISHYPAFILILLSVIAQCLGRSLNEWDQNVWDLPQMCETLSYNYTKMLITLTVTIYSASWKSLNKCLTSGCILRLRPPTHCTHLPCVCLCASACVRVCLYSHVCSFEPFTINYNFRYIFGETQVINTR